MERFINQIIDQIDLNERTLIGISGHGGAGKTTFAKQLQTRLGEVNYINTDPYITDSTLRKSAIIDYTVDGKVHHYKMTACHPAAHHLLSLERDVRMVREGVGFYTMDVPYLERMWIDPEKQVTIVEGMSVAFLDPRYMDLSVYLYTDGDTEFARRAARDITERGMEMEYLKASHEERRLQYELFMHPYRDNFQTIVSIQGDRLTIEKSPYKNRS
ncbi:MULTISPECIES: uridine kinase [unclassified Exiguobacterium]|uniref:uridine kinase family protein n=1 Tax=unclassified Exiguobacterium TaxID=2644629 RepID=UPI0010398E49|nr:MULTISPECIES: phosphoribulokinase [unclassified Exiguobacterium]TCI42140.1 phosphoribulokinase [Exiguobacterium sp. SH5S32]TCI49477.1 phosphoribulokinase [Exiguobacterium sp. SH1S4]TCI66834.1 phosphoribulokinase [Exiguobacterium sp. SH1S1]